MTPKDKSILLVSLMMVVACLAASYFIHWGVGAAIFIVFLVSISGGTPNDISLEEVVRQAEQKRKG